MSITFPGESAEYRVARDELLEQEVELRRAMERVAATRRALPPAGVVPCDERRSQQRRDPEGTEAGRHPQVRRACQRPQVRVVDEGSEPAASVDDRQGRGRSADRIGDRGGQLHLGGGTEAEVRGRLTTFSASTRSITPVWLPSCASFHRHHKTVRSGRSRPSAAHLVFGATLGWLLGLGSDRLIPTIGYAKARHLIGRRGHRPEHLPPPPCAGPRRSRSVARRTCRPRTSR
jgi:hypothetical protein